MSPVSVEAVTDTTVPCVSVGSGVLPAGAAVPPLSTYSTPNVSVVWRTNSVPAPPPCSPVPP